MHLPNKTSEHTILTFTLSEYVYLCYEIVQIIHDISYKMVRAPVNYLVDGVISPYLLEIGVLLDTKSTK